MLMQNPPDYSQKKVFVAPKVQKEVRSWQFNQPPDEIIDMKLQLLTVGGISICGYWQGEVGQYFSAWSLNVGQLVS